jgi:hypothetical protein
MSGLVVTWKGGKQVHKLMNSLSNRELQNRTRRAVRKGTAVGRKALRAEARSRADIPNSFAKTKTRNHRLPIASSVEPASPLFHIFEPGATSHTIAPGKLQVSGNRPMLLSGPAGKRGRERAFLASQPVTHPGMAARPLVAPVFAAEKDHMAEAAMGELLKGLER